MTGTSRVVRRGEDGFTLIEVLFAMIILSIGLLGLEALGIGAARSVARANAQSEFALVATQDLEISLQAIRNGTVPAQRCAVLAPRGDTLERVVNLSVATRPRVTVSVKPATNRSPRPAIFTVEGFAFVPGGVAGAAGGTACA
jgi:prepilin-type N-terminal cleavage/methylation domain-containing protein